MLKNSEKRCLTSFLLGRKCVFCGHRQFWRTRRGYRKCQFCRREKSLKRLKREVLVISAFRRQQSALLTSLDTGIPYKAVKRIYDNLRLAIVRECEREGEKLSGQIKLDETYFGGRRKGERGRGAAGKSIVFGLLEREGRVYVKVVDDVSNAKHSLYNYRGVSKSLFPLCLKEMEYRYNHRKDNLLQLFIHLYWWQICLIT